VLYVGTVATTGQGIGRPRDIEIDGAILIAARELLAEVGYAQVTMDATAARAGTSKAAIYRRYKSKAELLFAAAVHGSDVQVPADTGSLRGDLFALGQRIRSDMSSPAAREVAPHVIADVSRSPEVSQRLRSVFVATELHEIEAILARAVRRGELARMSNVATVHRLLGGALFFSIFVVDEAIDDPALTGLVDVITAGLAATDRQLP
jgi:AcrR family transcriptional regulator